MISTEVKHYPGSQLVASTIPTAVIPNKFQRLVTDPSIRLYSGAERRAKTWVMSADDLQQQFFPAVIKGSQTHLEQRVQAVIKRAACNGLPSAISATVEALSDPHYRKQPHKGPSKSEIATKVSRAHDNQEPINLVGLMLTRKNICPIKRNGDDISQFDLAEAISLIHLNSFAELIARFHPFGANFLILSEGKRFPNTFDYRPEQAVAYQRQLQKLSRDLGLANIRIVDYEDFLSDRLSPAQQQARQASYLSSLDLYQRRMLPIFDPANMDLTRQRAIAIDPKDDPENPEKNFVPLWRSILNSLPYPFLEQRAEALGVEYDQFYRHFFADIEHRTDELGIKVISKSWTAAIEHNARILGDVEFGVDPAKLAGPNAFRATINPKLGPNLGIFSIRETTSRVQPWHGTGYLETDRSGRLVATALSKLELEGGGAVPVSIDSAEAVPFFYASQSALKQLQSGDSPIFNASTRL